MIREKKGGWEVVVYAGIDPTTGKRRRISRYTKAGRRQAVAIEARLKVEVADGLQSTASGTVSDLARRWLAHNRPRLETTTGDDYAGYLRRYLDGTRLGTMDAARVGPADLDAFYDHLLVAGGHGGRPLAPATIRRLHVLLSAAFRQGVRWKMLRSNPATDASPPRIKKVKLRPPAPAAVGELVRRVEQRDPDAALSIRLAAATGARRGEVCALRWRDVDVEAGELTIARSIGVVDGGTVEKDTKSHRERRVALDPATVAALRSHRARRAAAALACGSTLPADGFLFSRDVDGATHYTPQTMTRRWVVARDEVAVELGLAGDERLHDLRHMHATWLLASGVPAADVAQRLGHANAAVTHSIYAHAIPANDQRAADLMGRMLAGGEPG